MSRSLKTPNPPISPDNGADVLPGWLQSRDVSTVGRPNLPSGPEPAASTRNFLKIPEVAERLRVSPRTVSRWIAQGTLRSVRIGRVVRVPIEAVDALMCSGKSS